ncbi:beta-CASP ribonuclease aCPSF1 [Stetteria hydrogenophila]
MHLRQNGVAPGSQDLRGFIIISIYKELGGADIASIEFEGPEIAVYVKNPKFILENEEKIKALARKLRKRVVVRTHPDARKDKEYTKRFILENAPDDVTVEGFIFDDVLGEVRVLTNKPGKLVGKGKWFANKVLAETGWRLVSFRSPPPPFSSKMILHVFTWVENKEKAKERRRALKEAGERIFRDTVSSTRYVRIIGLGGFGEVGRSAILLDTGESKVLLDAGAAPDALGDNMYPHFNVPEFLIDQLDAIVVTHAHMDHIGMIPLLFKYGFRGPVYATPPTRDLMYLMLQDFIKVSSEQMGYAPYSRKEIETMFSRVITVDYGVVTDVAPDVKLTFYNAGHILGSAMAHLHIGQGKHNVLYTGDIKYYRIKGDRAIRMLSPAHTQFQRVETIIMESTYGATEQQPRHEAEEELIRTINEVYKRRGKVLIPVMAVGRAQEILLMLSKAVEEGRIPQDMPIYIDGLIFETTAIHTAYPEWLAPPVKNSILRDEKNPFAPPNLVPVHDRSKRQEAIWSNEPAIVLATSGMMTGGPIREYFKYLAEDPRNALVFVSYQAQGTLGRRIKDGEREIQVEDDGKIRVLKINLEVKAIEGFSGHASRSELLYFLKHLTPKPRTVILNHGEPAALASLYKAITGRWERLGFPSQPEVLVPENLDAIKVYPRTLRLR